MQNNVLPRGKLMCDRGPFPFLIFFFFFGFQEDDCIIKQVEKHGAKRWSVIAKFLPGRIGKQCRERYMTMIFTRCVASNGWHPLSSVIISFQLYCNRSALHLLVYRTMKIIPIFRWYNHLRPAINRDAWTKDEEQIIAYYHQLYGNKWAEIARFLPGRYVIESWYIWSFVLDFLYIFS